MNTHKLKEKADKKWRTQGKENAKCEVCEFLRTNFNYTQLHPHHVVGRKNKRLRWELKNRCWLCPTHHTLGNQSAHNDSKWFEEIFCQFRKDDWNYCQKAKKEIVKCNIMYLEEVLCLLENGKNTD